MIIGVIIVRIELNIFVENVKVLDIAVKYVKL
jgi:hypothetical protein